MDELFPAFLKLRGRRVLLVGGGAVAASKLSTLLRTGAVVTVVAPEVRPEIAAAGVTVVRRAFVPDDLDGAWLVISAAQAAVNEEVARAAEARGVFVNAVDDPAHASLYMGGTLRAGGVTVALSTDGQAPALAGLLREGLEALLPEEDVSRWMDEARRQRPDWRARGVPIAERRPLLLQALNALYADPALRSRPPGSERPVSGLVSLVGAGPGDPGLLTVKAAQRLGDADLVLYDALVPFELVALAARARRFSVGKRARRHSMTQDAINRLLVRSARRGWRVVRLKSGDPFVFGRGGEEALALARAGVPFEVVPGVTAAVAAPALAGIPVTHRAVASGFLVVSGHAATAYEPMLSVLPPQTVTLVVLMGVAARAEIARLLLARGWPAGTPAAVLSNASRPDEHIWRGPLRDLHAAAPPADGVGTIVIGEVVSIGGVIGTATRDDGVASAPPAPQARRTQGER